MVILISVHLYFASLLASTEGNINDEACPECLRQRATALAHEMTPTTSGERSRGRHLVPESK